MMYSDKNKLPSQPKYFYSLLNMIKLSFAQLTTRTTLGDHRLRLSEAHVTINIFFNYIAEDKNNLTK